MGLREGAPRGEERSIEISRRKLLRGAIITGAGGLVGGASLVDMKNHEKLSLRFFLDDIGVSVGLVMATIGIMSTAISRDHAQNEQDHTATPPSDTEK